MRHGYLRTHVRKMRVEKMIQGAFLMERIYHTLMPKALPFFECIKCWVLVREYQGGWDRPLFYMRWIQVCVNCWLLVAAAVKRYSPPSFQTSYSELPIRYLRRIAGPRRCRSRRAALRSRYTSIRHPVLEPDLV